MDELQIFERVCRAMADPCFYPHPVARLERRDTHISVVFLTGDHVYKLKKPLDFGFLDYRGLENRRRQCEAEITLNQRLSHGVYEGVQEIRKTGEGFHLGDSGEVAEYAVRMKQLPDEAVLSCLLARSKVDASDMMRLGRHLARFYARSERSPEIDRYGRAEVVNFNTEENFRQLEPFVGKLVRRNPFDFIRESSRAFFKNAQPLFNRRLAEGRICDGHGDLRTEHVYFLDGIQIIDCIEFNERFRYGDTAVDLAFLHMDTERLGRPDLSRAMLEGYTEMSRDFGLYTLLDFYSCYRAIVKMKVACLTWTELEESSRKVEMASRAEQYLQLAFRYAVQFSRPTLWVFCGLPGAGKSTYAEKVKEVFGIPLFQSDRERRELPVYRLHPGPAPFGEGAYGTGVRGHVYARLLSLAHDELKRGGSCILDATFSLGKWREEALRLAQDCDANILFFECVSGEEAMLKRMARRKTGEDLSDARPDILRDMLNHFEKIDELPPGLHAKIDTEKDIPGNTNLLFSEAYTMKRTQVEKAIAGL